MIHAGNAECYVLRRGQRQSCFQNLVRLYLFDPGWPPSTICTHVPFFSFFARSFIALVELFGLLGFGIVASMLSIASLLALRLRLIVCSIHKQKDFTLYCCPAPRRYVLTQVSVKNRREPGAFPVLTSSTVGRSLIMVHFMPED